jgi:signal transduction histidine kinase
MEGYPIQVNPAHTKLFGVEPPTDYSVFKDNQLLSLGFDKLFDRIKKGEVVFFPDSYYNVLDVDPSFPDSPAWVKALGFTLNDNNGNPSKIVLMHENITERKNAEALLNDIIENNPMSIQIVDMEGYTLRGNPAFVQLFGSVPPPEFSIFEDLQSKSAELANLVSRVKNGEIVHLPDVYFNAHDAFAEAPDIPLWIRAMIFPLKNSAGKPERFVFMHENITERKLYEAEIHKFNEELEQRVTDRTAQLETANKELEAFSYSVSHDLRTPLRALNGFATILTEDYSIVLDDEGKRLLAVISENATKMGYLIDDLLSFSRLGRIEMLPLVINMKTMAATVYKDLVPETDKDKIRFTLGNIPPALGDSSMIKQVWVNLIGNAIKFTSKKTDRNIEIGFIAGENENIYYVKDNGAGFEMAHAKKLFGVFQRLHSLKDFDGIGAGLAIVRRIVLRHNGRVWAEGKVNEGATFYFTLPLNK